MKVKDLMRTHPDYDAQELELLSDLYTGGRAFRAHISRYLPRNWMEPDDVYRERCQRASYENHCAPLVDQWVGELCAAPVSVADVRGGLSEDQQRWVSDVDLRGTDLEAFWRERVTAALVSGTSYTLVDAPTVGGADRAQARELGLRPYLVPLSALQVLDWDEDAQGRLARVLWHGVKTERATVYGERRQIHTWTWYDRAEWRRFEAEQAPDKPLDATEAVEVAGGVNIWGEIPVVRLSLPPGLRIVRLLAEPALSLFNTQNALDWSLFKSAFATLVLQTLESPERLRLGAGGWLKLEPGDKYGYLEPSGQSFEAMDAAIQRKQEGLYRTARQMVLGSSNDSTRARASGAAKAQDRKPTEVVLGLLGSLVREAVQSSLNWQARFEQTEPLMVKGYESFGETSLVTVIEEALALQGLQVPSPTWMGTVYGRVAERYLEGQPELIQMVKAEIAASVGERHAGMDL